VSSWQLSSAGVCWDSLLSIHREYNVQHCPPCLTKLVHQPPEINMRKWQKCKTSPHAVFKSRNCGQYCRLCGVCRIRVTFSDRTAQGELGPSGSYLFYIAREDNKHQDCHYVAFLQVSGNYLETCNFLLSIKSHDNKKITSPWFRRENYSHLMTPRWLGTGECLDIFERKDTCLTRMSSISTVLVNNYNLYNIATPLISLWKNN